MEFGRISMPPQDFIQVKNIQHKVMAIDGLLEEGYDYYPKVSGWFWEVLIKEGETGLYNAKKEGPEAELLIRLVKAVGKDVHEHDMREMLGKMYRDSKIESALFYSLETCLVSCIDDELDEVRDWALECLLDRDRISNSINIESYLINLLNVKKIPYYLIEEAVVTLGNRGTGNAKRALERFSERLIRNPGSNLYEQTINNFLQERTVYGLELTGRVNVVPVLTRIQIFYEELKIKEKARGAISRIIEELLLGFSGIQTISAEEKDTAEDRKLERRIMDGEEIHEFEIVTFEDTEVTKISLYRSLELSPPDPMNIKIFTKKKDFPVLVCTLVRHEDDLEFYGYINKKINLEDIERIEVEKDEAI